MSSEENEFAEHEQNVAVGAGFLVTVAILILLSVEPWKVLSVSIPGGISVGTPDYPLKELFLAVGVVAAGISTVATGYYRATANPYNEEFPELLLKSVYLLPLIVAWAVILIHVLSFVMMGLLAVDPIQIVGQILAGVYVALAFGAFYLAVGAVCVGFPALAGIMLGSLVVERANTGEDS